MKVTLDLDALVAEAVLLFGADLFIRLQGIVLVNIAFLAGSVFGDDLLGVSGIAFSVVWAMALLAFGAWAVFANRRWVVNSVAVFGAVHFFTQWFIVLGAQPISILGGGLLLIAFGLGLARFNNWVGGRPATTGI